MEKNQKKQIEEIVDGLTCPKDFTCYSSGQKELCSARDIGMKSFLVCLELNSSDCKFSVSFGGSYFCQCPLRVYIAKKLNK